MLYANLQQFLDLADLNQDLVIDDDDDDDEST